MNMCASLLLLLALTTFLKQESRRPSPQSPSPMVDSTRRHQRVAQQTIDGLEFSIDDMLPKPALVFVPKNHLKRKRLNLLLHFHGANFVVRDAVSRVKSAWLGVTVHLGAGSEVYAQAFDDPETYAKLIDSIQGELHRRIGSEAVIDRIILSGFSAGYGAIRKILSAPQGYHSVAGVLLLDGIHTSYVPEGRVLHAGGRLNTANLEPFLKLARDAAAPRPAKRFLITHSEIFPGTFASTTECADYILEQLGFRRRPVLRWGPGGMQQLSVAGLSRFTVLGFAGNAAPDHLDHLHGMAHFLNQLMK